MNTSLTRHPKALKSLVALAIAAFAFLAIPQTSEAGHSQRYSHRCGSCGTSIYASPQFVGYNNCGQRVYRYVPQRHTCSSHRGHSYSSSYRRSSSKADIISSIVRGVIQAKQGHRHGHRHGH